MEFHQTRMGQIFFEHYVPQLLNELEKLNKNLESVVEELKKQNRNEKER